MSDFNGTPARSGGRRRSGTDSPRSETPGLPKPAFFNIIANDSQFSTKKARTIVRRRDLLQRRHTENNVRPSAGSDSDENSPPGDNWLVQSARPACRPPPIPAPRSAYHATDLNRGANIVANNKTASETFLELLTPYKYDRDRRETFFNQLFIVEEKIGEGSFGEVFRVTCKEDGQQYAVKRSLARFRSYNDRMCKLAEVQKHTALPKHVNLVNLIRAWEERSRLFIQTELCMCSLADYAEKRHDIDEETVWNYLVDLLHAVAHLHDHNLLHMDIKPENIFLSHDGICKLGDLGLVYDMQRLNKPGDTPEEGDSKYLAPEVLTGNYGPHNDIFSLGVTILELATDLDVPKEGPLWHRLREDQLPLELIHSLSPQLRYVIERMMSPAAGSRPTAHQLLRMVQLGRPVNNSRGMLSLCVMVIVAGFWSMWMCALRALCCLTRWPNVSSPTGQSPSARHRAAYSGAPDRTPIAAGPPPPLQLDDYDEPEDLPPLHDAVPPKRRSPSKRLFGRDLANFESDNCQEEGSAVRNLSRRICFGDDESSEGERQVGGADFYLNSSPRAAPSPAASLKRPSPAPRAMTTGRARLSTIRSQCDEQTFCPKRRLFLGGADSCTDTDEGEESARERPAAQAHKRRSGNLVELGRRQSPCARPPPSPVVPLPTFNARRNKRSATADGEQTCTTDSGCDSAPSSPQLDTSLLIRASGECGGGDATTSPGSNARTPTPLVLRSCSACGRGQAQRKRRMPTDSGDADLCHRLSPGEHQRAYTPCRGSDKRHDASQVSHSPSICACGEMSGPDDVFHSPRAPLNLRNRTVSRSPMSLRANSPSRLPSLQRRRQNSGASPLLRRPTTEQQQRRRRSGCGQRRRRQVFASDAAARRRHDDGHESDDERDGGESPDAKAAKLEPLRRGRMPWHVRT